MFKEAKNPREKQTNQWPTHLRSLEWRIGKEAREGEINRCPRTCDGGKNWEIKKRTNQVKAWVWERGVDSRKNIMVFERKKEKDSQGSVRKDWGDPALIQEDSTQGFAAGKGTPHRLGKKEGKGK